MAYLDETGDPVLDELYKELDAIKGYTKAESLRRIELKDQIRAIREQQDAMRDLGVGSLRTGVYMTMAPEIAWLANRMAPNIGYSMMMADPAYRLNPGFSEKEKEDYQNLHRAAEGKRGDEQHQEWAKGQLNKYHGMKFGEWMEQIPEFMDELVPFKKTLGSKAVEDAELLLVLGWGIHGIAKLFSWAATKGIPKGRVWLRDKIRSIVKNKQSEEILDDIVPKDIVPEASLQIEHKPLFEARIDKTVERTMEGAGEVPLLPSVRTGYMPSTSGYASPKTKMYHGAKGELPEEFMGFEDYASSTGSAYGGGFYTTSRTGTAKGYAGKKGKLYEVTPKKEVKLFDMEQPVPPSIKQSIKRGGVYKIKSRGETFEMRDEFLLSTQDFLDENPKASLVELYDEMRALAPYADDWGGNVTPGDLEEYFQGFGFILQESGYKGLRHKGGVLSSRPKKHEVNIYWNPGKDLNIKPVAKADLAAGEKTVERATAGEKVKPKPAKTKPKTEKEFDQKWTQKKDEFQSKYDQDVEAIYASAPAGKITPEKIERVEALTKKLKKRIDKVYVEMDKDFAYLEKQAKIKYAADRKKLKEAEESISVGEIPEEIIEKLLDKRLLKTGPKHFQGTKEYTAWKIDKNIAYTRSMLVDEADKLYKWYNKTLDSLYKANDKAGDEILAGAIAKIKKTKGGTLKEQKARIKDIEAQFKVELDKVYMERELQRKEIEAIYAKGKEKLEKASVSLQETLKKEQADLAAGKITRHSRGGLVENKVNYALNQWK